MSDLLYHTRVRWDGRHGIVKCGEIELELRSPPDVMPDVAELDYAEVHPGKVCGWPQIRPRHFDRQREMEAPEIAALKAWIAGIVERTMRRKPMA